MRTAQKVLRKILVFALQGLAVLIFLEIGIRVADPFGISYYPETARFLDTMVHEEPIGYRLQPNLDGIFHSARYQINSLGLRGPEIDSPKETEERRILFLGDSFVFGIGVNNDQTLSTRIEDLVKTEVPDSKYRVINMGVPSYNTEQELIQLEGLQGTLDPNAVILFFVPNDIEKKKWVFEKRESFAANFSQRSYALSTFFILVQQALTKLGSPPQLINLQDYSEGNVRWVAISDSLQKINSLCKARSIPFVVYLEGSTSDGINAMVEKVGKSSGFDVVGLEPWSDPRWAGVDVLRYRNSKSDSHPNAEGTSVWGRLIYEDLSYRNIIRQRFQPELGKPLKERNRINE